MITTITEIIKLDSITKEAEPSHGVYVWTDAYFDLRVQDEISPKVGDYFVDSENIRYWVMEVRRPVFGDYWGLNCRSPNIKQELAVNIYLYTSQWSVNEYGDRINSQVKGSPILAAIQPEDSEIADWIGKRGYKENFRIYLADYDLDIPYGSIIEDDFGTKYSVLSHHSKRRIGELEFLEVVITP